jgi:hypothetical protein
VAITPIERRRTGFRSVEDENWNADKTRLRPSQPHLYCNKSEIVDRELIVASCDTHTMGEANLTQLAETEIPDQLNYHRANFRELSALDRRLSARFALGSTIVVAGVYGIWVYYIGSIRPSWTPIAVVLFLCCPRWQRLSME